MEMGHEPAGMVINSLAQEEFKKETELRSNREERAFLQMVRKWQTKPLFKRKVYGGQCSRSIGGLCCST